MSQRKACLVVLSLWVVGALACGTPPRSMQLTEKLSSERLPQATAAAAAEAEMVAPPLEPPNDEAFDAMFFESYGVNPFVDTEDDRLSTFALDVDTGSYTIVRRYLNEGNTPPDEAVRVEEFVNYFDQDYDYPSENQAFALYIDGSPFPFAETERYRMMRVGIQGYAVAPEDRIRWHSCLRQRFPRRLGAHQRKSEGCHPGGHLRSRARGCDQC